VTFKSYPFLGRLLPIERVSDWESLSAVGIGFEGWDTQVYAP
jgi:hypothetical protein